MTQRDMQSKETAGPANPAERSERSEPVAPAGDLLQHTPAVINVGLEGFADELAAQGVDVVQLDWRPPAGGDPELADLLSRLGS
jgi:hypothetical protein